MLLVPLVFLLIASSVLFTGTHTSPALQAAARLTQMDVTLAMLS